MRQTTLVKHQKAEKNWYLIDASEQILGRLAAFSASILRGKNKATFTPHVDMGDYIIIINAAKVRLSANKENSKIYYRHSGYPGGLKKRSAAQVRRLHPERLLEKAIKGMLPHTKLGRQQFRHLFVYADAKHSHQAQKPLAIKVK